MMMTYVRSLPWGLVLGLGTSVVVLMLAWDPPVIGPLAGLDFDWSNWNVSDVRPMPHINAWPADPGNRLKQARVVALAGVAGPESLAFDADGVGPYTGVGDGRIIRWDASDGRWRTFGVTSSVRTEVCDIHPPSVQNEHICGRPLGLRFAQDGNLYIADAYFGLVVMGPAGGVATPVSTGADGVPFRFTNDLDLDENGTVYFTDSSSRRPRRQNNLLCLEQERSGRLLKYEPQTGQTTVLAQKLHYPNGLAVSHDSSFLLLALTSKIRIMRYWLKGPKAGTMEEFAEVPGYPDNIRRTPGGSDFWVALHSRHTRLQYFLGKRPYLLRLLYSLPLTLKYVQSLMSPAPHAMVVKYDPLGEALEAFEDRDGTTAKLLSFAEERDGILWMSSVFVPRIWLLALDASASSRLNLELAPSTDSGRS